jgi:cytochrome b6-f complex iron-sulfur subunit
MAQAAKVNVEEQIAEAKRLHEERERLRRTLAGEGADSAGLWSRRDVVGRFGWGLFGAFSMVTLLAGMRSAFPRVLFQPPTTFRAGRPEDYAIGEVSEKFKKEFRVWIVRSSDGFYALFAKCTHLGCTPRWLAAEDKFKCPCHGSGFYRTGINFEGPAPRPLERLKITLSEDGQLVVDKGVVFLSEKGQWDEPGAFLKLKA